MHSLGGTGKSFVDKVIFEIYFTDKIHEGLFPTGQQEEGICGKGVIMNGYNEARMQRT